jgi:zinc-ribbon family
VFFVIWGFKRYVTALAMLTLVCGHCQRPTAHPLRRVVTKFTLFWIPLFPTSTKFVLQCSYCGYSQQVSKEESERLQASGTSPAGTDGAPRSVAPTYDDSTPPA